MVDQYAPHHLGRNCEEMGAILPLHALVVNQTHVGFIYQGSGLERVAWALALHEVVSQATKLFINDRGQAIERALVSFTPGAEEPAYVVCIQLTRHCRPSTVSAAYYSAADSFKIFALAVSKPCRILRLSGLEEHMKTILISIAAGSLLAALAAAQPRPRYNVIDLGTLGGTYSFGFGVNNAGEVAGAAATPAQVDGFAATAFVWTKHEGISNLGVFGPPLFPACPTCNSDAAAVGARGEVAMGSEIATLDPNGEDFGQFDPANPTHRVTRGAIWRNGVMTALPNLPGGNNANAFWINSLGQVSGFAENGTFDSSCSQVTPFQVQRFQPVIWGPNGEIHRVLSPFVSRTVTDTVAFALTINDNGEVVGASGLCGTTGLPPAAINNTTATHAVLWERDGSVRDLGNLGGAANIASSINNRGEVVGTAQTPDGTVHTFRWTRRTGMLDYGSFPGAVATVAGCCHTINDGGEIVGFTVEPTNPYFGRAIIWQGTQPQDLNAFVRDAGPFVQLTGAFSINEAGEIVCQGVTNTGDLHACLAVPDNGATANESVSPASWQPGSYVPLTDNARELLQRRFGTPQR